VSNFFSSDIVKESMNELAEMQQELIQQVLYVPYMSKDQKKEHLQLMKDFLEKQKNLFFRMTLSDDAEAQEVRKEIIKNARMFGVVDGDANTGDFFDKLDETIDGLAKILDL
jgi:NAD(P)H-hydrate repair Nnr-like enzyme with NAD(P)H-hydrate dehydratase domain